MPKRDKFPTRSCSVPSVGWDIVIQDKRYRWNFRDWFERQYGNLCYEHDLLYFMGAFRPWADIVILTKMIAIESQQAIERIKEGNWRAVNSIARLALIELGFLPAFIGFQINTVFQMIKEKI